MTSAYSFYENLWTVGVRTEKARFYDNSCTLALCRQTLSSEFHWLHENIQHVRDACWGMSQGWRHGNFCGILIQAEFILSSQCFKLPNSEGKLNIQTPSEVAWLSNDIVLRVTTVWWFTTSVVAFVLQANWIDCLHYLHTIAYNYT